jgi:hypothetical protein
LRSRWCWIASAKQQSQSQRSGKRGLPNSIDWALCSLRAVRGGWTTEDLGEGEEAFRHELLAYVSPQDSAAPEERRNMGRFHGNTLTIDPFFTESCRF